MDNMKGFMGKVRRRRLALFLVFALVVAISPKIQVFAFNESDGSNIAVRAVRATDTPTPTPTATATAIPVATVDPAYATPAATFLVQTKDLLNTKFNDAGFGKLTYTSLDSNKSPIYTGATGKLQTIIDFLANYVSSSDINTIISNSNPVIKNARALKEELANESVTGFNQIIELIRYADEANEAIAAGIVSTSITKDNYSEFCSKYLLAKAALEEYYYPTFEQDQNLDVLGNCLGDKTDVTARKNIKNARIVNLSKYEDMTREYNILYKFESVKSIVDLSNGIGAFTYEFNPSTCEQAKQLKQVVDENGTNYLDLLYNGSVIRKFLNDYKTINNIIAPLEAIPYMSTTTEQIQEMNRILKLYDELSPEMKKLIPSDTINKMNQYATGNVEVDDVTKAIDAMRDKKLSEGGTVQYPKTDTEYATFKEKYNTAYSMYLGLLAKYPNSGIGTMVGGINELLGDMTTVYNFLERVRTILNTEDNQVCNNYSEMEKIVKDYKALSTLNQSRIYNYVAFYTMYENATVAQKLRTRVDKLLLTLTADELDRQEVAAIRKEYSALNAKAKAYFGTSYANYIDELEYGNYAKSLELAARVDELIARIGTVNTNSGQKIEDAESAYNSLTDMQKALVKTYATLVAARKAYDGIANDLSKAKVSGVYAGYVYTRSSICPSPKVIINNKQLVAGTHYTLSYSSNKNVGTAKITITAVSGSGYYGTYTKKFKIVKDSIADGSISGVSKKYKYTGKYIKPVPKLKVNGHTLTKNKDYTISYKNNKKKGTATITLKGKGNYKGTKKKTFKIVKK